MSGAEEAVLGEALRAAAHRLHQRGLLAGGEGNLSCRLPDGTLLVTASGADKGALAPDDLVRVDLEGRVVQGAPGYRPSSEVGMHLALYAARPEVGAVVHAHPPVATGFATAGETVPDDILPEVPALLGPVALVPYARPGTPALAAAMAPYASAHDAFLLANHGATTVGGTLRQALLRMESLEQAARILLAARLAGGARPLPHGEAEWLARGAVAFRHAAAHHPRTPQR